MNINQLTDIQIRLVKKSELPLDQMYKNALKEIFFPLHVYPILKGETYAQREIFDEVIDSKKTKMEEFTHVMLDKNFEFDSNKFRIKLRSIIKQMVSTKEFMEDEINELCASKENIEKLGQFYDMLILKDKISVQNFDMFYDANLHKIEEYLIINEKITRSASALQRLTKLGKRKNMSNRIASSTVGLPALEDQSKLNERQNSRKVSTKSDQLQNQNNEPLDQVNLESSKKQRVYIEPTDPQNNEISDVKIAQPKHENNNSESHLKNSKFNLNELKHKKIQSNDEQFQQYLINFFKSTHEISSYYKNSFWPLQILFRLEYLRPWKSNPEILYNYFGQKVTFFFRFVVFLLFFIFLIMFFGLALWIFEFIIWYFQNEVLKWLNFAFRWLFGVGIICWIGSLYFIWIKKTNEFETSNGIIVTELKTERVSYKTKINERSLVSDEMNAKKNESFKSILKLIVCFLIMLIFYGMGFAVTIGLFFMKDRIVNSGILIDDYAYINQNITNLVEVIRMTLWDIIFRKMAIYLVDWVNPKYVEDYQKYLVSLMTVFTFFNHFFVIFTIMFFKEDLLESSNVQCAYSDREDERNKFFSGLSLGQSDINILDPGDVLTVYRPSYKCLFEVRVYVRFYIIIRLFWNIGRLLIHLNYKFFKLRKAKKDNENITNYRNSVDGKYKQINIQIENQIFLKSVSESNDYDTNIIYFIDVQ